MGGVDSVGWRGLAWAGVGWRRLALAGVGWRWLAQATRAGAGGGRTARSGGNCTKKQKAEGKKLHENAGS